MPVFSLIPVWSTGWFLYFYIFIFLCGQSGNGRDCALKFSRIIACLDFTLFCAKEAIFISKKGSALDIYSLVPHGFPPCGNDGTNAPYPYIGAALVAIDFVSFIIFTPSLSQPAP
ncbi:MAG: hypothetical protein WC965_04170 [Thiohalomonadaceae bacterium]